MLPAISIIIPVYNAESYLEACITSILNQTFTDFELILVNDGSTDQSESICRRFATEDNRVVCVSKPNGGSSSAKNKGMEIARGKFIEFVDADDTIDRDYTENLWKGTEDPQVDLCVGNMAFCKITQNAVERREMTVHPGYFSLQEWLEFYPEYMPRAIFGSPCNKLYKKDIIQKFRLRFDERLKNNEDTHFNYAYIEKCRKIYASEKSFYNYMDYGKASASKGYIPGIFDVYLSTYQKAVQFLTDTGVYAENKAFSQRYFIDLVIGALNGIVVGSSDRFSKKMKDIKQIVTHPDVKNALTGYQGATAKKTLAVFLMRKQACWLLYLLFSLNRFKKT